MSNQYTHTRNDKLEAEIAEAVRTDSVYNVAIRFNVKQNQVCWIMYKYGIKKRKADSFKTRIAKPETDMFDVSLHGNWLVNEGFYL